MTQSAATSSSLAWSCTAFFDEQNSPTISTFPKMKEISSSDTYKQDDMEYNLSSPREWMEAIEAKEDISGAYTVIRCDLRPTRADANLNKSEDDHLVWGEEFHLERIASSYELMVGSGGEGKNNQELQNETSCAIVQSKLIIDSLIQETKKHLLLSFECDSQRETSTTADIIKVVMITLLWQPLPDRSGGILVRGHAFSTNAISDPYQYDPTPTNAAISACRRGGDQDVNYSPQLPSRFDNQPLAKLSSWCSIRRPLESQFKTGDTGEVILTRKGKTQRSPSEQSDHDEMSIESDVANLELLEGLTSNLFVVYKDGSLRTASTNKYDDPLVLNGYARHLVLEAAERCGLKVEISTEEKAIKVQDGIDGLWAEAFFTSSIRLIIPIGKILLPQQPSPKLLWERAGNLPTSQKRVWDIIYRDIIHHQYGQNSV